MRDGRALAPTWWVLLTVGAPGFVSQRRAVQTGVAVASFVLLLVYIGLLFLRIR